MVDDHDTEYMRHALPVIARQFFGDPGQDWLDDACKKLNTTWRSATYKDLLMVEEKLQGLQEAARGIPAEAAEPSVEPQPAADRDVLKEIAEEKITPDQVQYLEEQAAQYRLNPMELAALARNYGADNLAELKDVDYSRLVRDILKAGTMAGRQKPRRGEIRNRG
jgi:hypothetical protein